ncbi:MAG TPA: glycoside hydrolase family 43 protein [Rugosimonospora sp.]|nr:glycoside hydrolase family 43 protein [Rugosimonospora sp.]
MPTPPLRRTLTTLAAALLAALGLVALRPGAAAAATYAGYVSAYFTESPDGNGANYGLHLAVSADGLNWTPLNQNNPVATPTLGTGGLRDPFILRKQDGTFEVLATDLNGTDWSQQSQYIHVWDSTDLRTFTNYRLLHLHSMATHSWAPEAFWDASRNAYAVIYSSVNASGHNVIMVDYTTDFTTVTSGPTVFFDPGYDVIDGDLTVGVNGYNYLYFKANSTLVGARSTSLDPGSFSAFTGALSPGRGVEAPEVVPSISSPGTYYLWGDTWSPNGRFFAWQTTDLSSGSWTLLNDRAYTQPLNSKHAGYTRITAAEMANLIATWGAPAWNRLKSYNYPDRYWRHYDFVGRIDVYPFDPYQDQMWTLVPGLADSAGVSFESVNYPGMYLRHSDFELVLNTNDGTTQFAQDATFYKVSGFADSSWTSFRSYNYPTRYIRHSNYVLRIDPITSSSSSTDQQDATFRVGY